MQYKGLLLASFLTMSVLSPALAQKSSRLTVSSDSTKQAQNSCKPTTGPVAASNNLPAVFIQQPEKAAVSVKPVPLAGEISYYGSMNDYVSQFVMQYMSSHNRTLSVVQNRSTDHFSLMENVLQKNNIPKELKYLAVIESALNNNAVSRAGAVGPWQLMESTARILGLTVNRKRDDRTDWYKSTHAAAKYLGQLYGQLNDWLLVVAAYNSGPTPVQRAIDKTGSHNFWDIKKYLPRETQGHVLAFIATASIFEHLSQFIGLSNLPTSFNFSDVKPGYNAPALAKEATPAKPVFTQEELSGMAIIKIADPLSLDFVAQELSVDKKLLNKWNPDYDLFLMGTLDDKAYSLRIPKDKLDKFIEKKSYLVARSKRILDEQVL
jgi:membrane-bound lytic murein transglycosylase D